MQNKFITEMKKFNTSISIALSKRQNYANFHLIMFDNGNSDNTYICIGTFWRIRNLLDQHKDRIDVETNINNSVYKERYKPSSTRTRRKLVRVLP